MADIGRSFGSASIEPVVLASLSDSIMEAAESAVL
jgi:hypothetical protein